MSRLILYMAKSLDGFISGPVGNKANPTAAGDRDARMHGAYTAVGVKGCE